MLEVSSVSRLAASRTRSFCPENPHGESGRAALAEVGAASRAARDLGRGWKIDPYVDIPPGATHELANLDEPGCVRHLWATTDRPHWRRLILRAYWDGADEPAIEVPYGDFFCNGWGAYAHVASAMVVAAPHGGMNSYRPMPFHEGARITLENIGHETVCVYYQVDVETGGEYEGHGMYSGTYLAWGSNSNGWWGEGEVKFWLDDDEEFPTVATTGLEDYMSGAWNFDVGGYQTYTTPYLGLPQVIRPDGLSVSQQRFGMYRWHVPDPIRFAHRLDRVDVQALGWYADGRYKPSTVRPALPGRDLLSV